MTTVFRAANSNLGRNGEQEKKVCAQNLGSISIGIHVCPFDSIFLCVPEDPKCKGSGKCAFSSVAFLFTGVGVNQAKIHTQIMGKIKQV